MPIETAQTLLQYRLIKIRERLETIAPAKMNEFPRSVQRILESDMPLLLTVVEAAERFTRSGEVLHTSGCAGYPVCACGLAPLVQGLAAIEEVGRERSA